MTHDNQNSARGLTPEAVEEALQAVDSRPWGDETLYECKGGYLHAKPLAAEVRRLRALLASRADALSGEVVAWQVHGKDTAPITSRLKIAMESAGGKDAEEASKYTVALYRGNVEHGMIPGSHERANGAECWCGSEWSRDHGICYREAKIYRPEILADPSPPPALPVAQGNHPSVQEAFSKALAQLAAMPDAELEKLLDKPVGDVGQFILDTSPPALSEGLTGGGMLPCIGKIRMMIAVVDESALPEHNLTLKALRGVISAELPKGLEALETIAAEVRRLRALLASRADAPPTQNAEAWQLLYDIRDGKVNPEDEADKFLREFPAPDAPPRGEAVAWGAFAPDGSLLCDPFRFKDRAENYCAAMWGGKASMIPLFPVSPPPALPVAQDEEECEDCDGTGSVLEVDEVGAIPLECEKCRGAGGLPTAAPALSEGLTEAVETALAWFEGDDPAYDGDAEVNYGKILAAEVRRLSPAPTQPEAQA